MLISNSVYRDKGIPDLPGAAGCASSMRALLAGGLCGWPDDRIEILQDLDAPHELARRLVELAKHVQDVMLLYYVGHGMRTANGQLALAVGESNADSELLPHTALLYESVARILRGCPAVTKLVILDCCHAELGNKANYQFQSADIDAESVDGLYFIGASRKFEKAKSPLSGGLTYFTEAFIEVVVSGIPGKPSQLTIDQIFTELRARMLRANLPEPVQSGIREAHHWRFALNAARPETHRDLDREIDHLIQQLAESEKLRALAETKIQKLEALATRHASELKLLKMQALAAPDITAETRYGLRNAIDTAERLLDGTITAQTAAKARRLPDMSDAGHLAVIKVVGIGGGGVNAINRMIQEGLKGVEFIVINTDAQSLLMSDADVKLDVGKELTRGLGSGANPDVGFQATENHRDEIEQVLRGAELIIIVAGEGGGTGSGGAPVVAWVARSLGALTIGVVTRPFGFEGKRRAIQADSGIAQLRSEVDTLIVIPEDRLLSISDRRMSVLDTFKAADEVLLRGVQGITDLITTPGLVNLNLADVKSLMSGAGPAVMGTGSSRGDDRSVAATEIAISSPLLEASIDRAHGVLLSIQGGSDLGLFEINEAAQLVANLAAPDANVIFGAVIDDKLGDEVRVTIIATGFDLP